MSRTGRTPVISLLVANYLSWIGNTMTLVAVPLYVLDVSGSALQAGAAGFANALPMVIAGLVGGVVVDRIGPRATSVYADLAAGVFMAAVPLLDSTLGLSMPLLMALLFLRTLADAPGAAARLTLLPSVLETARVRPETGNSLFHSAQRVALVAGPPAAALMVAALGPAPVLYVDAATFLVSALLIRVAVPPGGGASTERPLAGFWQEVREGQRFILRTPVLAAIISVVVVTNFVDDAFTPVLLPVYSEQILHDARLVGLLLAANGVGAVLGSFLYVPASRRLLANRYTTFIGAFALIALARLVMVARPGLWPVAGLVFLIGLASGPLNPLITTVIQRDTPPELLGRVFGAVMAMAFAAAPVGIFTGGWLVSTVGLQRTLAVFAGVYLLLILYATTNRPLRALREPADDRATEPA
ncbi:MFS transporter [Kitasatospora aureofaciens]|uniref:MFS transporter n=1 Tax=Kitasatospora aureofaciens TaxID=1894 RepID=UPI00380854BB